MTQPSSTAKGPAPIALIVGGGYQCELRTFVFRLWIASRLGSAGPRQTCNAAAGAGLRRRSIPMQCRGASIGGGFVRCGR